MNELRERVAQAIKQAPNFIWRRNDTASRPRYEVVRLSDDVVIKSCDSPMEATIARSDAYYEALTQTVLMAVRIPTARMLAAGRLYDHTDAQVAHTFTQMIDAELSED